MKQLVLLIFCCIALRASYAQEKGLVNISCDNLDVFYFGVENPITVLAEGIPAKDISIKASNGKVKGADGHYKIILTGQGNCTIEVFNKDELYAKKEVRCMSLPVPQVFLGKLSGNANTTREVILENTCLSARIPNFLFEFEITITSFTMVVLVKDKKDGKVKEQKIKSNGNCLSDEMKELIKSDKTGNVIRFENVLGKNPSGNMLKMAGLTLLLGNEVLADLGNEKQKVAEQLLEIETSEKQLQKQDSAMRAQAAVLAMQKKEMHEGKKELEDQQKRIASQKKILDEQLVQINSQKTILIIAFGVILVIVFLLVLIVRSARQRKKTNVMLAHQNEIINEKQKEILDSIYYARRIQRSLLPTEKYIRKALEVKDE